MKYNQLILVVLALAALLACGCSGDDPATPGNETAAVASPGADAAADAANTPEATAASYLSEIDPRTGEAAGADWRPVDRWWERQQLPGTAQGCWFRADDGDGAGGPAADPHLALVGVDGPHGAPLVACGPGLPGLDPGAYAFADHQAGFYNRPFGAVTPDGNTYAVYLDAWVDRTLLLRMPDDDTLWIEVFEGPPGEPALWEFTSGKQVFRR